MRASHEVGRAAAPRPAVIIGLGYLGRSLARELGRSGGAVIGTLRRPEAVPAGVFAGQLEALDVGAPAPLAGIVGSLPVHGYDVFYLVPPGRLDAPAVVIDAAHAVVTLLEQHPPRRVLVASSTAVYGDVGGGVVDADTRAEPGDARGRLLLEGERLWQASALPVVIVRLAGLYGPGRVIGERDVRAGSALPGDPGLWLNLVHVDDAATLFRALSDQADPHPVELGCDGHPVLRGEYYRHLAACLAAPAPRFDLSAPGLRAGARRCDNRSTCARTGWRPTYADYRSGLDASLAAG